MKQLLKLKQKLRSSDSANGQSSRPSSVPSTTSTSQIATPSCHQSTGSSLTVPDEGSPAPTPTSTETNEAATVSPPSLEPENAVRSVPERLWNKAYDILEEKEPEVVKSYQEILQLVQHEWTDTTAPEELQALEHCKTVKSRQMWRLVYSGLEKSKRQAKLKESVSNIIETIENLKGVVDKAVKYSSEAAIAWAGVTLGLEILSNPMKEPGLNRKGIAYVLSRMEWYWNLVELVLQDNSSAPSATLRTNLETQIIDFYKKLLLFQMKSACLYYRNWAGVILRDAVKLDDWAGELNTIKDAERLIQKDIEQYDNQDIRLKLGTIETSSVDQAESLETICKILREEARLKEKNAQDDKDRDCLAALLITDPRKDKKRIQSQKGDPLKDSYEWILKSDAYQTLIDNSSSRILWINGPPGKGKTMLLCGIIDELQKSLRPISFFLCQANVKEEDLSSDIAVLRGLIYVLLEHQPSLISAIRPSYDKQKDRPFNSINSSELLGDILTTMLQDPSLNDAILLVDALDECTINRSKLIKLIADLSESCNTKWIVSSRDWPEIQQELADATGLICLDLEQEHEPVSQAVKSYIRKKVDDLAKTKWKNDSELKDKVFDYMQSHADDTFLWVALVCERLANSSIRKRLVMEELVKFPTSLVALYQAMLDRITNSPEADRLKQILALVCIVYRPLSSAEIPTLVEFMDDYDEEDVEDVIASCGSFLTLQNGEIFFVHQSAKEFLLDQGHRILFPHGTKHKHAYIFCRSVEGMQNTLRQDIYELGSPGTLNPVEVPSPDPFPKSSVVRQSFCYQTPEWIIGKPQMGRQWDRNIQTIYTRPGAHHATYSPDGCYLAVSHSTGFDIYETLSGDLIRQEESRLFCPATVYSPDGQFLCCSCYGSVLIFSASTLGLVRKLEHKAKHCFFLPDGNSIALVHNGDVAVFNWKTGKALSVLDQIIQENSNIAVLTATHIVGISPTATEVQIWNIFTGECNLNLSWYIGQINSVACSVDGQQIAAASADRIRLWHLDNTLGWVQKHDLYNEDYAWCLTFSGNSRMLISGSLDNLIRVWDETGGRVKVLKGHSRPIKFLSVCGNQLASGSRDNTLKLWDLSDIVSNQLRQKQLSPVQTCDYPSQASLESSYPDEGLGVDSPSIFS
nr:hypothetical protein FVER53263_13486 [Fusarium verticillioides]